MVRDSDRMNRHLLFFHSQLRPKKERRDENCFRKQSFCLLLQATFSVVRSRTFARRADDLLLGAEAEAPAVR